MSLTRYDGSFLDCTDLHPVAAPAPKLGLLALAGLGRVENSLRLTLGLDR